MNRNLLLPVLFAVAFYTNSIFGQEPAVSKVTKAATKVTLGIKLGANLQELSKNSTFTSSYKGGFVGGFYLDATNNNIGLDVGLVVKAASYAFNPKLSNSSINVRYLDIPVLLEYKLIPHLWIQAGPQFSAMASQKDGMSGESVTEFNTVDIAGVVGLKEKLTRHIFVGGNYSFGFININNKSISGTKDLWNNRSVQFYVGLRLI